MLLMDFFHFWHRIKKFFRIEKLNFRQASLSGNRFYEKFNIICLWPVLHDDKQYIQLNFLHINCCCVGEEGICSYFKNNL